MRKIYLKTATVLAVLLLFVAALQAQTPIYTNEFSDGALPAGWTTDDLSGQGVVWTWCGTPNNAGAGCVVNWASYSDQHDGDFASTTAANGFVLVDSDAAGSLLTNHQSVLTTSAFDFSAESEVWVKFESLLGVFENPTLGFVFLQVSTDGTNWTNYDVFDIAPGNTGNEPGSVRWTLNPQISVIDISADAAGQSTVYLRWFWEGNYEYYWLMDDLAIYNEDPSLLFFPGNDLRVNSNFFAIAPNAMWPLSQVEQFGFLADVENVGLLDQSNVNLNITITDLADNSVVYTEDLSYGDIPADSLVENVLFPSAGFLPTDMTVYEGVYTISSDSTDENPDNNTQIFQFAVTDTLFAKEAGPEFPAYPAGDDPWNGAATHSWAFGAVYYIKDATDLYARTVGFSVEGTDSNAGEIIQVRLYKWNDANDDSVCQSDERTFVGLAIYTLTGSELIEDIITLPVYTITGDPIALESNTHYIVMVEYEAPGTTQISFGGSSAFDYGAMWFRSDELGMTRHAGLFAIEPTLENAQYDPIFGTIAVARLSIGDALTVGTDNFLSEDNKVSVFPNPATDKVNLSMELTQNFDQVQVSLLDLSGKVLETRSLQNVQEAVETFRVSELPAGSYILQINTEAGNRNVPFQIVK